MAKSLSDRMLTGNARDINDRIEVINRGSRLNVGVVGPNGRPVFGGKLAVPERIFLGGAETSTKEDGYLIFYKPLPNEKSCHACHNPADGIRGMVVIKSSLSGVNKEISGTAKRLLLFALLLGLTSEIFLLIVLRRLVLKPLDAIRNGAEKLMSGNLDHRVFIESGDEFGAVAEVFNEMAGRISDSQSRLETAVRQKTKELKTIAELSTEVFRGNLTLRDIIERFLDAIMQRIGYRYAVICLVDRETGLLIQEFKKGIQNGLCGTEIPLSGGHPFADVVRQARPAVRNAKDISLPESYGTLAIIPILSHQRKRCREATSCLYERCPAYGSPDERCWLISGTLCRSPQAVAGKEKIYGCLHCGVFPVLGVLIAGVEELSDHSMHSLEILASEIASAIENKRLIETKKEDIESLVKLHDISVEKIQSLDKAELVQSIVTFAAGFANMDAAILYLRGEGDMLLYGDSTRLDARLIPRELSVGDSFVGRTVMEERPIESLNMRDAGCLSDLIDRYGFLYVCTVPLKFKGEIYGCLTMFKKKDFFMTDSEKALILLFAAQSAAALNTVDIHGRLREEKEFSEAVFNNMSMGIMALDSDGIIRKLNPAGFDILKVDDFIIGRRLDEALPQAAGFLTIDPDNGREVEIPSAAGTTVPIGFNNSPLLDAGGEQTGTVVAFRDLTEIKKLQAEIRKKQHFEAMGKVIAGVAHEIRNPLFGISSLIQILERDAGDPQTQALLKAVFKETQRMKNLIEELLLYSRPSKLNITDIELGVFMEKLRQYVKAKREGAGLKLVVPAGSFLRGDSDKLTQVLLNLIDNGLNSGARNIEISASEDKDKGVAVVSIADDGAGIKKENLEKIFEPFYTTRKEGTGLGLSICKKLVEDHGGSIELKSEENKGTTVLLSFPLTGR